MNPRLENTASKNRFGPRKIKEPFKLVLEIIFLVFLFLPWVLWAGVTNIVARKKSLKDNVVLVTGAAGDLGRELCLKFAELGCRIACVDVIDHRNEQTVRIIKKKFPEVQVSAFHCDITSVEEIKRLHKDVVQDLGSVDLLVNNAAIIQKSKFLEVPDEVLDYLIDVNFNSHFWTIRQFLPDMLKRNSGHIVAISSVSGLYGLAEEVEYSATKHGINGLMESLYEMLRKIPGNAVKTTTICPYIFRSAVFEKYNIELRIPELLLEEVAEATIEAIRKNKTIVSIPSLFYFLSGLSKLVPQNIINMARNIVYVKVKI